METVLFIIHLVKWNIGIKSQVQACSNPTPKKVVVVSDLRWRSQPVADHHHKKAGRKPAQVKDQGSGIGDWGSEVQCAAMETVLFIIHLVKWKIVIKSQVQACSNLTLTKVAVVSDLR
jgi:hypothetical protein